MSWIRERKLDMQESWLVYSGKVLRGLRRLSPQALREKAIELNDRQIRRNKARLTVMRQLYQEDPSLFPFHSAPTQPLDKPTKE